MLRPGATRSANRAERDAAEVPVGEAPDVVERQPVEDHVLARGRAELVHAARPQENVAVRESVVKESAVLL